VGWLLKNDSGVLIGVEGRGGTPAILNCDTMGSAILPKNSEAESTTAMKSAVIVCLLAIKVDGFVILDSLGI
jgi:hypothetical protein